MENDIKYPSQTSKNKKEKNMSLYVKRLRDTYNNKGTCKQLSKEEIELCESIPGWKWEINNWCSKEEFIQWFKKNRIENQSKFRKWCKKNKRPDNIPYHPERVYKNWSWYAITGIIANQNKKFVSEKEFIHWCKDNGIENQTSFRKWCKKNKRPDNIPHDPIIINISWSKISGYTSTHNRNIITKKEFIQWCKDNGIKNSIIFAKWKKENKKPDNIPSTPQRKYNNFKWGEISGRRYCNAT